MIMMKMMMMMKMIIMMIVQWNLPYKTPHYKTPSHLRPDFSETLPFYVNIKITSLVQPFRRQPFFS